MKKIIVSALCVTALFANPYESNQEEYNAVVKTGGEVSSTLLKTLGMNLKKKMKAGGPMVAASFCTTEAYNLTEKVSKQYGKDVSVKRISLKERNPANKPIGNELTILDAMDKMQKSGVVLPEYFVEHVNKDTYKYYKPLSINKQVCLKCHGDVTNNTKLSTYLNKAYPHDKATGYHFGDLRGAVVVTIKK